jgi:uncharacterized membrane protein
MHAPDKTHLEEKIMSKKVAISALILAVALGSLAYAFDGNRPHRRGYMKARHEILSQLPEEKEMLFHKTMREAREKKAEVREQVRALKGELKDILTAPEFNEELFRQKMGQVHELQRDRQAAMEEAIVTLAKQFTPEERKILAELVPHGRGRHGHTPAR